MKQIFYNCFTFSHLTSFSCCGGFHWDNIGPSHIKGWLCSNVGIGSEHLMECPNADMCLCSTTSSAVPSSKSWYVRFGESESFSKYSSSYCHFSSVLSSSNKLKPAEAHLTEIRPLTDESVFSELSKRINHGETMASSVSGFISGKQIETKICSSIVNSCKPATAIYC